MMIQISLNLLRIVRASTIESNLDFLADDSLSVIPSMVDHMLMALSQPAVAM